MVRLWIICMVLNPDPSALMCFGRMSLFDPLCHGFGAVSILGFSLYNDGIAISVFEFFIKGTLYFQVSNGIAQAGGYR